MKKKEYTVVIRTLGTSGSKYQQMLDSLMNQTIKPHQILVYIPYGYDIPKETVGVEKYIRSEKGMVTQRSLPFEEVETEIVLFSDDDMYYPHDFAEKLLDYMEAHSDVDSIVPNIYDRSNMTILQKIFLLLYSSSSPRKDDGWALKIKKDAGFSYNVNPSSNFLPTQSGPGGCIFCKLSSYRKIHFDDERWLEQFKFASYEDQLFHYKMNIMGLKVVLAYKTGIKHLDARATKRPDISQKMYFKKKLLFVLWYRSLYKLKRNSNMDKFLLCLAFLVRAFVGLLSLLADTVRFRKANYLWDYFKGYYDGYRYVHSDEYKRIPSFDAYCN